MKLKKLVALITAGALCLGMSLTAFAADNSREKLPIAGNGVTEDGVVISSSTLSDALANGEITEEEYNKVVDTLGDPEKIKDVIKEDLQLPSDAKVAVLGVMNYEPEGTVKDGSTVTFALSPSTGNGVYVDVELDDFSPVAFVKVMSNGDVVKWNAKGEVVSTTSTTTKKVSPKTGE